MSKVKILDCTLRDGGYINDWKFGKRVIGGIIRKLEEAKIDIIECGFLRDVSYDSDVSVYSSIEQISGLIPDKKANTMYVAMIALGDISVDKIAFCDGSSIDGIRLTFHKHEWDEAKEAAKELIRKGYKVFIQPVGTTSYSDEELLSLIGDVNLLNPFAFYLVDTLGILYKKEMCRVFDLIDKNLDREIAIGFHSHNNLQLSFSNAQELMEINPDRQVILDASVYGMGRGVGNLATELITDYINENMEYTYSIIPLLSIADRYIMPIYAEQRWGYDLPYFLSATVKCHPNYASYLLKKTTLKVEDINHILQSIPKEKRELFDFNLAEDLYYNYQKCTIEDSDNIKELKKKISEKEVLLIAPGGSIAEKKNEINEYINKNKPVIISVNHVPEDFNVDMVFISNSKRFDLAIEQIEDNCDMIVTSNIQADKNKENIKFVNYSNYIGEGRALDNAGAMLIRLLKRCKAEKVSLAGFDGFSETSKENFSVDSYRRPISPEEAMQKNNDISCQLSQALNNMKYQFITSTRYIIK